MDTVEEKYSLAGKCSRAYKYWCFFCSHTSTWWSGNEFPLTQGRADQWAREEGWSKKKQGWACPDCTDKK